MASREKITSRTLRIFEEICAWLQKMIVTPQFVEMA
jgi:hypothetical protein